MLPSAGSWTAMVTRRSPLRRRQWSSRSSVVGRWGGAATTTMGVVVVAATGGTISYLTTNRSRSTDHGYQGVQRQLRFWSVLSPIIFDYWWNMASSSPYVKYQKMWIPTMTTTTTTTTAVTATSVKERAARKSQEDDDNDDNNNMEEEDRSGKYKELHERNAPRLFQVMLDLGGLYIKLGQVLSVTALPIPEQYRVLFRTLQSTVPGHAEFESIVKPTLERELGRPLEEIFDSVEVEPCGAASIGQAHRAVLKETGEEVVIKVQYPSARWQVPADITCVGDFLKLCVFFDLVDEDASKMSYKEFSRQFLAELDYDMERTNLEQVYQSTLDPRAPYMKRGVVVPKVYPQLCTHLVITMSYLPGPKFEEEAKRQLELVGIRTNRSIRDVVREATKDSQDDVVIADDNSSPLSPNKKAEQWQRLSRNVGSWIGVDAAFSFFRLARKLVLWSQLAAVSSIRMASALSLAPASWEEWAQEHRNVAEQIARVDWTRDAVYALLDVHGYQILNQGLFNADPHPGNLLIVQDPNGGTARGRRHPQIGLIDFGQCKRLTEEERVKIARLLLSVADQAPDEEVATRFRDLGIQTKNDSTRFLAEFARLMFGSFKPEHLQHSWHKNLHTEDKVTYFPNELSMVYRTSLLLRGLAMSLQLNVAIGEQWRYHAINAIDRQACTAVASLPSRRETKAV